jgi:prepilin-type processing-associated H-X9-DG protein
MNMWLSPWIANKADRIDKVGPPATLAAFADGPGPHCSLLPSNQTYSPVAIHQGRVNVCFLDTHVKSLSGRYVGCGVGFTQRADIRWQVPGSAWPGPQ